MPFMRLLRGLSDLGQWTSKGHGNAEGKCWATERQKGNGTNKSWNRVGENCPLVGRKVLEAAWGEETSSVTRGEGVYSHAFKLIL